MLKTKSIPTINPYTANASDIAIAKNGITIEPCLSAAAEIAAVPTVFNAQALPSTDKPTESAADIASIGVVGEL